MKSLIKKIISFTSTISLIWSLAACSVDATDSKSEPSPKQTVATPVFSVESGEVTSGTTVEITCSTEGAAIYYTTDGSVPTAESTRYTTPITIEPPMTVKAIAIKDGMNDSAVAEVEYTELIIDYFEEFSDFYGICDVFNGSNSYKVEKLSDKKIYCTYYADECAEYELSSEILTYSVSGNIASLKGESGTEFAIYIKTKEFIVKNIIFDGTIYDLNQVWINLTTAETNADLRNFLTEIPNNTKDTPYKIKLSYIDIGITYAIKRTNKFLSIKIDDSVTTIGMGSFSGCTNITSVTIPSSVNHLGESAFDGCTNLTSVTIPSSVTDIRNGAFRNCTSLTSVTIPSSVTDIRNGAFCNCTSLTSVTIPSSVTGFGQLAFGECTSLRTINYTGTEEQWNAIPKGVNWNYDVPSDCVIICNYQE